MLVSFPGRSHLQYLITYGMQIRRGKAREIWSRAVTSGRQKGVVPVEESRSPFLYYRSEGGGQSVSKAVSILSIVHSARDGLTRNGNYYCQAPPPRVSTICLPDITARDKISQAFPLRICIL